jgi:arginase family enzyme
MASGPSTPVRTERPPGGDLSPELTKRLGPVLSEGGTVLVLGGNCTIALAVMTDLQRLDDAMPGLLYMDWHFELNIPESLDGALDWMGLRHTGRRRRPRLHGCSAR